MSLLWLKLYCFYLLLNKSYNFLIKKKKKSKNFHKLLKHSLESKRVPEDISSSKSIYCHKLTASTYIDSTTISLKIHTLYITIKLQTFNSSRDQNRTNPIFRGLKPKKKKIQVANRRKYTNILNYYILKFEISKLNDLQLRDKIK